ncbi:MAG: hypothetical protein J0I67_09090 [Bosea sp.]|nr:hypothetical protein [Bosea sp. (in: a-proteobacteria)]
MTIYLLDENVLRELHPKGHARVRAWHVTVSTDDLRIPKAQLALPSWPPLRGGDSTFT